jgi:hypothetical protein
VHEHIFAPLGMTKTAILPELSDNPWIKAQRGLTQCYTTGLQNLGTLDFAIPWYPAGMATGTISDFRKFAQALLPDSDGMSSLFMYSQTQNMLYFPTSYYPDGDTGQNYHGFWSEPHLEGTVIGHGGNTIGMSSVLQIDIENNLGVVIMTNQASEQVYNRQLGTLIFGKSDFSQIDNSANDVHVNGAFRSARTFQSGMLRMHALVGNTMPLIQRSYDTISVPLFGELHRVAPGVYISSEDSMLINYVFFVSSNEAGEAEKVSMMFGDYTHISWGLVIFEIIITLLLIISGLYGFAVLIRMLVNRIRKREQSFLIVRASIAAALLLITVNFAIFAISAASITLVLTMLIIHGIIHILLTLSVIACTVILLLKLKTSSLSKIQKRQLIAPSIICAFLLINTVYWQLGVFWV